MHGLVLRRLGVGLRSLMPDGEISLIESLIKKSVMLCRLPSIPHVKACKDLGIRDDIADEAKFIGLVRCP